MMGRVLENRMSTPGAEREMRQIALQAMQERVLPDQLLEASGRRDTSRGSSMYSVTDLTSKNGRTWAT
jgi:hypothetical protein